MNHDEARAELSAYIDGRLAPDQVRLLEQHLGSCRECGQEMAAVRATRQMLHALPEPRVPRPFTLEAQVARGAMPALFFWLRAATALAAACFVLVIALPVLAPATLPRSQVAAPSAGQLQSKPELAGNSAARQGRDGQPAQPTPAAAAGSNDEAKKQALPPTAAPVQPRAAVPAGAPAAPDSGAARAAAPAPMPNSVPPTSAPVAAPLAAGQEPPEPPPTAPAAAYSAPAASEGAAAGSPESATRASAGASPTAETIVPREAEPSLNPLAALRSLLVGMTLLLASATGAIWWRHRSR